VIYQTIHWSTGYGCNMQSPIQATSYWFMSLQSLLTIFQNWIKTLRYHPTRGFVEARDQSQNRHQLLASRTPSPIPDWSDSLVSALHQYDVTFAARWYQLSPYDAIWTATLPPSHFPQDTGHPKKRSPHETEGDADIQPPP
jgi:hypothetical protein